MAGVPGVLMSARSLRPDGKTMMHIRNRPYLKRAYDYLFDAGVVKLCINSSAGARSYAEWLGMNQDDFSIIHNGIDFNILESMSEGVDITTILQENGVNDDDIVVGSVFRFVQEKRPQLWVEVMSRVISRVKGVKAIMVGDGALHDSVRRQIEKLGMSDDIILVGQSKHVKSWLDRFDLFLLTSMIEGLPNVLIEAQAFGVPVVSTDAGGSRDTFVDGTSGFLTMEDNADSIAEIVIEAISNREWLNDASLASETFAKDAFSKDKMIDRLLEIYSDLRTG